MGPQQPRLEQHRRVLSLKLPRAGRSMSPPQSSALGDSAPPSTRASFPPGGASACSRQPPSRPHGYGACPQLAEALGAGLSLGTPLPGAASLRAGGVAAASSGFTAPGLGCGRLEGVPDRVEAPLQHPPSTSMVASEARALVYFPETSCLRLQALISLPATL